MPFRNSIVGGMGKLIRQMIQSPNYVAGSAGWSINRDGSAEFNNATVRGVLQAGSLTAGSISSSVIGSSTLVNDTIIDTDIVIDDTGGTILVYAISGQTVTTLNAAGAGTFNVPAGVTSMKVETWGAGGGAAAGGIPGTAYGGCGAGGGEYACEPNYTVIPLAVLPYTIGAKGVHGTGNVGTDGGDTTFNGNVIAHGGKGALGQALRPGGIGSTNTLHFNGGPGGIVPLKADTAGAGGGSSAGVNNAGTSGTNSSSAVGAPGGVAPTGGGNGGAGGNNGAVGVNGVTPGGGGGGGGATGLHIGGDGADGQIRLTYGGTRVLVASFAGVAGVDKYGNAYVKGFRSNIDTSAGLSGGYYEEIIPSAVTFASGAFFTMVGSLAGGKLISDYGSAWNAGTGQWTCPADGTYDVNAYTESSAAATAAARGIIRLSSGTAGAGTVYTSDLRLTAVGQFWIGQTSMSRYLIKGTVIFVSVSDQTVAVTTTTSNPRLTFIRRG